MHIVIGETIFGIPPYSFFAGVAGMVASVSFFFLLYKKKILIDKRSIFILLISLVGVIVGARLFGVLTKILIVLSEGNKLDMSVIKHSGLVYYGGLLGTVCFYLLGIHIMYKQEIDNLVAIGTVIVPLFHSISRIGCLFAGCCYGVEYNGIFSIAYVKDRIVSNHFPIQILEAAVEMLIFLYLLFLFLSPKIIKGHYLLQKYFELYAWSRMMIELLRGDSGRGVFWGVSFSQFVSITILLFVYLIKRRRTDEVVDYN